MGESLEAIERSFTGTELNEWMTATTHKGLGDAFASSAHAVQSFVLPASYFKPYSALGIN